MASRVQVDGPLEKALDDIMEEYEYGNRSQAVRKAVREMGYDV